MKLYDELVYRGFVKQVTNEEEVAGKLNGEKLTYYAGFDPTADSLHVGSLVPIMALAHLQKAGHIPIVIIGGGTAMIGDPSGKTELRRIMSSAEINANVDKLKKQLSNYINLDGSNGILLDNADWLLPINYIEFLRDIGVHFRVNEMVRSEGYRQRLEREVGLSFVEFNYQLLQAYDFLILNRNHACSLQLGGDDQWGNILAGVDLVRRVERKTVHGLTFPLITTSSGAKMGKTASGAVWLSPERTSPYDFYQYWIRSDDADVVRFLKYFTFLPKDEIEVLAKLKGADIRKAKRVLAYEATKLCHGKEQAKKAEASSDSVFGGGVKNDEALPCTGIDMSMFSEGVSIIYLLTATGLCSSNSDAIRLIKQGGIYINDNNIPTKDYVAYINDFLDGELILRKGKKHYHKIVLA